MKDTNILTVKDLINLLKNFDPDLRFGVYTSDGLLTVDKVNGEMSVEDFDDGEYLILHL